MIAALIAAVEKYGPQAIDILMRYLEARNLDAAKARADCEAEFAALETAAAGLEARLKADDQEAIAEDLAAKVTPK